MFEEQWKMIDTAKKEWNNLLDKGGVLYVDSKWNVNLDRKLPKKKESVMWTLIELKSRAQRKKEKLAQTQKQLSKYDLAFKSDIKRLEKSIKDLKASLEQ